MSDKSFNQLLEEVKESKQSSSSSSKVILQSLSAPVLGKFGEFRVIQIDGKPYNIDSRKVVNANFFQPSCEASITLAHGTRKDGTDGVFINNITVMLPAGVMSSTR